MSKDQVQNDPLGTQEVEEYQQEDYDDYDDYEDYLDDELNDADMWDNATGGKK